LCKPSYFIIPKKLRDDYTSGLDKDYFAQVLAHKSIDPSHNTIAIYMGGEPSVMGEGGLRSYINILLVFLGYNIWDNPDCKPMLN
jgi:hypothetical protein